MDIREKITIIDNCWSWCGVKALKILVNGLADIASNLGEGSFSPSREDSASRPLRIKASETLRNAGYQYYEGVGKDRLDGWFTEEEICYLD